MPRDERFRKLNGQILHHKAEVEGRKQLSKMKDVQPSKKDQEIMRKGNKGRGNSLSN